VARIAFVHIGSGARRVDKQGGRCIIDGRFFAGFKAPRRNRSFSYLHEKRMTEKRIERVGLHSLIRNVIGSYARYKAGQSQSGHQAGHAFAKS
jgi:hypothetical protein